MNIVEYDKQKRLDAFNKIPKVIVGNNVFRFYKSKGNIPWRVDLFRPENKSFIGCTIGYSYTTLRDAKKYALTWKEA